MLPAVWLAFRLRLHLEAAPCLPMDSQRPASHSVKTRQSLRRASLRLGIALLMAASMAVLRPLEAGGTTFFVAPGDTTLPAAMARAASGDSLILLPGRFVLVLPGLVQAVRRVTSHEGPRPAPVHHQ